MTEPLPPSPRVRVAVTAVRENMAVCEKCGGEATPAHSPFRCHGECDRLIPLGQVITIEVAERILIAYAISTVDRLTA